MSPKQKKSCRIPIKVHCLQCYHSTSSTSTLKYWEFAGSYYSSPKRKVVSPYLKKHIQHPVHPQCLKYYKNKNLINDKGDFDFLSSLVAQPSCTQKTYTPFQLGLTVTDNSKAAATLATNRSCSEHTTSINNFHAVLNHQTTFNAFQSSLSCKTICALFPLKIKIQKTQHCQ